MKLVLVAGLGGAIGGTLASILSHGENTETRLGMVTHSPKFKNFDLPFEENDDLQLAGWDLHNLDLFEAVQNHGCVPSSIYRDIEMPLRRIPLRKGLVPGETAIQEWFEAEAEWLEAFKRERGITGVVLVNLCPTAATVADTLTNWENVADLDWRDLAVTIGRLYFRFAIEVGAHFINFTPNACEADDLIRLAGDRNLVVSGRDGKTGQTFLKTLIAPAFRDKNFRIDGWFSTNILGNEDGRALSDQSSASTKIASKRECLEEMLGYRPGDNVACHQVAIHYYPPRGDAKEAWDNIDFSGVFGRGMQLKLNWLGQDSILAAPAVLDLIRLTFLAERTGQSGVMDVFGYFFKSPLARSSRSSLHDIDLQFARLINWAKACQARLGGLDEGGWTKWPLPNETVLSRLRGIIENRAWAISGAARTAHTMEQEFLEAFAAFIDMPYGVACASGSSALVTALEAAGIGYGDRVLVPPSPWVACASTVMRVGAIPVFCDLEPGGLCMSPTHAATLLDSDIKAVLLVHSHCSIADVKAFVALCSERGIPLIEDCSQAHGAEWAGRKVGSFGDMSVFSMQESKVLTSGEGGVVLCRTKAQYESLQQLRADGRRWTAHPNSHGHYLEERGQLQGHNYCLSEIQSGLLLSGLTDLPDQNRRRAENALHLNTLLRDHPVCCDFFHGEDCKPAIYEYTVRLPGLAEGRLAAMAHQVGQDLKTKVFAFDPPIYRHPLYQPRYSRRFPASHVAEVVRESQISLPEVELRSVDTLCFPHRLFLGDIVSMERIRDAIVRALP